MSMVEAPDVLGTHYLDLDSRLDWFATRATCPGGDPLRCECPKVRHGYPPRQCPRCGETPRCWAHRTLIGLSVSVVICGACLRVTEMEFNGAVTPLYGEEDARDSA